MLGKGRQGEGENARDAHLDAVALVSTLTLMMTSAACYYAKHIQHQQQHSLSTSSITSSRIAISHFVAENVLHSSYQVADPKHEARWTKLVTFTPPRSEQETQSQSQSLREYT